MGNWRQHNVKETDCNTDECPPVLCTCSTPRNGTGYRHNKMVCSDGTITYCNVNEECYASEPFAYGELYNACSSNPPPPECKSPWNRPRPDSLCYMVSEEEGTWDRAKQFCSEEGGMLAEPRSPQETTDIVNSYNSNKSQWIGLQKGPYVHDGKWSWTSDGSGIEYSSWYPGEPNETGKCARIDERDRSMWDDIPCAWAFGFVCQKS